MFYIVPNILLCLHYQIKNINNNLKKYKMKNLNITSQTPNKPVLNSNSEIKNSGSKSQTAKNVFCSADLWNIQKMSRTSFERRRWLMC